MLHPYAMPDIGRWLWAEVIDEYPISVRFHAKPDSDLDSELAERIKNQFAALHLSELFSIVSAPDIAQKNKTLERVFGGNNPVPVESYLREIAKDAFQNDENSRQGVLFEALADNNFYCSGGFSTCSTYRKS